MDPITPNPQAPDNQPPVEQPVSMPPNQPASQAPAVGEDPGKGLAIAGIVLAFFFCILGLILSIMAKKKSTAAGFHNTLATAGIILNAIFLTLSLIFIPILAMVTLVSYNGIQERAMSSSAESSAQRLNKYAELYFVNHEAYATSLSQLNSDPMADVSDNKYFEVSLSPLSESTAKKVSGKESKDVLNLYTCGGLGNKIGYWDYQLSKVMFTYTFGVSESSNCSIVVD